MVTEIEKPDIRKLRAADLEKRLAEIGQKPYRAKQIHEWLWKKAVKNFDDMTNLSADMRDWLKDNFTLHQVRVDSMQQSADGTIKNAVTLPDGMVVESVLIPTEKRISACVSSQVGCSLACQFCATARLKRERNLSVHEIYDQVVLIRRQAEEIFNRPLTNIVFMGMGEPLLNYSQVKAAIDKITSPDGLNMAARRLTLSTVGIAHMIKKMADEEVSFNLAVSLHNAIQEERKKIMPISESNPLDELMDALQYWYKKTKSKVTFEYVVWKNYNDTPRHAKALLEYCKKVPSKVNLIEYNPIDDGNFLQADESALRMYMELLESHKINTRVRRSRGKDIDAACGQLANKL